MDILDSPLNLAHRQARCAEASLNRNMFSAAIVCHQKAAAYLEEVIEKTSTKSAPALLSLKLQLDYHKRQQSIVREIQRKKEMALKRQHSQKIPSIACTDGIPLSKTAEGDRSGKNEKIHRTLNEYDTLIQFLDHHDGRSRQPNAAAAAGGVMYQSAMKVDKDDDTVIEELQMHNESLRTHVMSMEDENKWLQRQVEESERRGQLLRNKLHRINANAAAAAASGGVGGFQANWRTDNDAQKFPLAAALDLPPLEMPHFDFDLLSNTAPIVSSEKPNHDV